MKTNKIKNRIFIAVFALVFILATAFGLLCINKNTTVQADETAFTVKSVTQTDFGAYNIHAEWEIAFNASTDMFGGASDGEDITAYLSNSDNGNFMTNVKINGATISSISNAESNVAKKPVVTKISANRISLKITKSVAYSEFTFVSGLKIGDYTLQSEKVFYENQDWTYTASATRPDFKLFTVYEFAYNGGREFHLVFNDTAIPAATAKLPMDKIYFDGTSLYDLNYRPYGEGGEGLRTHGVNWDAVFKSSDIYVRFPTGTTAPTVRIAKDFVTNTGKSLSAEQTFVPDRTDCDWNNLPVWSDTNNTLAVSSIMRTHINAYSGYRTDWDIQFSANKDLFSDYAVDDEITNFIKNGKLNDIYTSLTLNGSSLKTIETSSNPSVFKFLKAGENKLRISIQSRVVWWAEFGVKKGMKIGNYHISANDAVYYSNDDGTFEPLATRPAFKLFTVYEQPNGSGAREYHFVFNAPAASAWNAGIPVEGIYFDGVSLKDLGYVSYGESGNTKGHFVAWETVFNYMDFRVTMPQGSTTPIVTVDEGYTTKSAGGYTGKTIAFNQTFVPDKSYCDWNNLPVWTEYSDNQIINVSSIKQIELGNNSKFEITFDKNILDGTETEVNLLDTLKTQTSFTDNIKFNDKTLTQIIADSFSQLFSIEKNTSKSIVISFKFAFTGVKIEVLKGLTLGDKILLTGTTLYENSDCETFTTMTPTGLDVLAVFVSSGRVAIVFNSTINPDYYLDLSQVKVDGVSLSGNSSVEWAAVTNYSMYFITGNNFTKISGSNNEYVKITFNEGLKKYASDSKSLSEELTFYAKTSDVATNYTKFVNANDIESNDLTYTFDGEEVSSSSGFEFVLPSFDSLEISTDKTFVGYAVNDGLYPAGTKLFISEDTTVDVVAIDFFMVDGAYIRAAEDKENSGLRFSSLYNTADYEKISDFVQSKGTLILPTDYLTSKEFVIENFEAGVSVLDIKCTTSQVDGENTRFNAAIVNILESNYDRAFSARAYIEVKLTTGETVYIYTGYVEDNNSRSIKQVAQTFKTEDLDSYNDLTAKQQAVIDYYIDKKED